MRRAEARCMNAAGYIFESVGNGAECSFRLGRKISGYF